MEDHKSCCICFNDIGLRSNYTMTECSHYFCSSCIFEWLTRRPDCPMCRKRLVKSTISHAISVPQFVRNQIRIDPEENEFEYVEYLMNNDDRFRAQYHRIGFCVQSFFIVLTFSTVILISIVGYIIIT